MGMAVAERRHHESALGIDILCLMGRGGRGECGNNPSHAIGAGPSPCGQGGSTVSTFPSAAVRSEIGNDSVFNHKVCIIDTFHMIHLRTLEPSHVSRQDSRQRTDIIYDGLHTVTIS